MPSALHSSRSGYRSMFLFARILIDLLPSLSHSSMSAGTFTTAPLRRQMTGGCRCSRATSSRPRDLLLSAQRCRLPPSSRSTSSWTSCWQRCPRTRGRKRSTRDGTEEGGRECGSDAVEVQVREALKVIGDGRSRDALQQLSMQVGEGWARLSLLIPWHRWSL
eukprot:755536-Hanusia_phi.AAC.2